MFSGCRQMNTKRGYFRDDNGVWWHYSKRQRIKCVEVPCMTCGRLIPRRPIELKRFRFSICNRPECKPKGALRGKQWKGGVMTTKAGYVQRRCPKHPRARNSYVFEHILVMEKHLGRHLLLHETVHHKNGIRNDNRLCNLELWSKHHPAGQRIEDKVTWAKEILNLYAPHELASTHDGLLSCCPDPCK